MSKRKIAYARKNIIDPEEEGEQLPFEPREIEIHTDYWYDRDYELHDELLGRGKFGEVRKCSERGSGLILAAKIVTARKQKEKEDVRKEIRVMSVLRHPKVLQIYDAFESNKKMCIITELIEGGELFDRIVDETFDLTERVAILFMRQIIDGMAFIHSQNILHLDMKPENIICVAKTGTRIKIIDFGLAMRYDSFSSVKVMAGTVDFMSPEVCNYEEVTTATDMWSIGVICYVLVSGLSPFCGDDDSDTICNILRVEFDFAAEEFDEVTAGCKDFIKRLLVKDPRKRMSAADCMKHSWLNKITRSQTNKHLSKKHHIRFFVRRKWKKVIKAVIAMNRFSRLVRQRRESSEPLNLPSDLGQTTQSPIQIPDVIPDWRTRMEERIRAGKTKEEKKSLPKTLSKNSDSKSIISEDAVTPVPVTSSLSCSSGYESSGSAKSTATMDEIPLLANVAEEQSENIDSDGIGHVLEFDRMESIETLVNEDIQDGLSSENIGNIELYDSSNKIASNASDSEVLPEFNDRKLENGEGVGGEFLDTSASLDILNEEPLVTMDSDNILAAKEPIVSETEEGNSTKAIDENTETVDESAESSDNILASKEPITSEMEEGKSNKAVDGTVDENAVSSDNILAAEEPITSEMEEGKSNKAVDGTVDENAVSSDNILAAEEPITSAMEEGKSNKAVDSTVDENQKKTEKTQEPEEDSENFVSDDDDYSSEKQYYCPTETLDDLVSAITTGHSSNSSTSSTQSSKCSIQNIHTNIHPRKPEETDISKSLFNTRNESEDKQQHIPLPTAMNCSQKSLYSANDSSTSNRPVVKKCDTNSPEQTQSRRASRVSSGDVIALLHRDESPGMSNRSDSCSRSDKMSYGRARRRSSLIGADEHESSGSPKGSTYSARSSRRGPSPAPRYPRSSRNNSREPSIDQDLEDMTPVGRRRSWLPSPPPELTAEQQRKLRIAMICGEEYTPPSSFTACNDGERIIPIEIERSPSPEKYGSRRFHKINCTLSQKSGSYSDPQLTTPSREMRLLTGRVTDSPVRSDFDSIGFTRVKMSPMREPLSHTKDSSGSISIEARRARIAAIMSGSTESVDRLGKTAGYVTADPPPSRKTSGLSIDSRGERIASVNKGSQGSLNNVRGSESPAQGFRDPLPRTSATTPHTSRPSSRNNSDDARHRRIAAILAKNENS